MWREAPSYSQFCDILGDAPRQSPQVLVAASYHGVQASALLGALRAGQAAAFLLAWREGTVSQLGRGRCLLRASCTQGPPFRGSSLTTPWPPQCSAPRSRALRGTEQGGAGQSPPFWHIQPCQMWDSLQHLAVWQRGQAPWRWRLVPFSLPAHG